jgi:hypothetical protein
MASKKITIYIIAPYLHSAFTILFIPLPQGEGRGEGGLYCPPDGEDGMVGGK